MSVKLVQHLDDRNSRRTDNNYQHQPIKDDNINCRKLGETTILNFSMISTENTSQPANLQLVII